MRELADVAEAAFPDIHRCWANQEVDALVTMQHLVTETIAQTVDADALATQVTAARPRS